MDMSQLPLAERPRAALRRLTELAAERARAEVAVETAYEDQVEAMNIEKATAQRELDEKYSAAQAAADAEFATARQQIDDRFEADNTVTEQEYRDVQKRIADQTESTREQIESAWKEAQWTTAAVYEVSEKQALAATQETAQKFSGGVTQLHELRAEADELLARWGQDVPLLDTSAAAVPSNKSPLKRLTRAVEKADAALDDLADLRLPRWCQGRRLHILTALVWLVVLLPAWWLSAWYYWLAAVSILVPVVGVVVGWWLNRTARQQVHDCYAPLYAALTEAEAAHQAGREQAAAVQQRRIAEADQHRQNELEQAEARFRPQLEEITRRRELAEQATDAKYPPQLDAIAARRDTDWRSAEARYQARLASAQEQYENAANAIDEQHQRQQLVAETRRESDWQILTATWVDGIAEVQVEIEDIHAQCQQRFPDWSDWTPPTDLPPALPFGQLQVTASELPNGTSRSQRLRQCQLPDVAIPALLPFPARGSVVLEASADDGRDQALEALQMLALRYLTAMPPGKVRLMFFDPVGLGENFAAFMHLADYQDALVAGRIWTEPNHFEQRLADLTVHIETVIQKYLRNEYRTIAEYNAQAGEVAEPLRILVVANFPVNFTPEAARRLVSVANSGARCGVYTLVSVDTRQPLPSGFHLQDLEQAGTVLVWDDECFAWHDDDFAAFPLAFDASPGNALTTSLIQGIGQRARAADRVEVDFGFLAPPLAEWWTTNCRDELVVPLGRAGATRRQSLRLGQGTAQHALIAGKTGSGKSSLLHVLITNLALNYSPDEVELYLVDFKKGVEFQAYATQGLPHARVIAVESEREFGLSVLQRLDAELRRRGDLFRDSGTHDLASYRGDGRSLPRILLVVDEFQEFFVEDDRLAQEAALLLDRLVRQGRAFGLHVVLGSQTLGGAYTLARSTIDQMAVRVALQCSDADAHLILSRDNGAARLLARPGEAIYNDANGLVEGNDPFQVAWLPDQRRDSYLEQIHALAKERQWVGPRPVVFAGNVTAGVDSNTALSDLLNADDWSAPPRAPRAWLGEALAIKDPTAAVFQRPGGSHLLVMGQDVEAATGVLAASIVALAAQHGPGQMHVVVLDTPPADDPNVDVFGRVVAALPHSIRLAGWRELADALSSMTAEIAHRQAQPNDPFVPYFLVVNGLQRFRDLRRPEDDYTFSRRDDNRLPQPHELLSTLLRDGPAVGVFVLAWCDTLTALQRIVDRTSLREFGQRILFQMNAADSSTLIDSPLAAKLGRHRALFYSDETGQMEKFRPYGPPSAAWLDTIRTRLKERLEGALTS
jgi:hypothetical protein